MATVHVDLDELEIPEEPSVTFTLDGREWACKPRGAIPAFVVDGILGAAPMRLDTIYRALLVEDQVDEFMALLARPDSPFGLTRMQKLAEKVTEAVLNRPTQRPVASQRGPLTTGATSRAGSSSRAGRSKKRAS